MERGQTYRFQVNHVDSCPLNKATWENASVRLNCSRDDSRLNRYYCVPNQQKSALIEFCYDQFSGRYEKGKCIRLYDSGFLNSITCSTFGYGCPNASYLGDDIYEYPACLQINPHDECYIADPSCPVINRKTTTPYLATTDSQETVASFNTNSTKIYNQLEINDAKPTYGIVLITITLLLLILVGVFLYRRYKKRYRKGQGDGNPLLNGKPTVSQCCLKIEGEKLIIFCEAFANPPITFTQWFKNEEMIDTTLAQKKYSGGSTTAPSLIINSLERSDLVEYRCIVRNMLGETESEPFSLDIGFRIDGDASVVFGQQVKISGEITYRPDLYPSKLHHRQDNYGVKWIKVKDGLQGELNLLDWKYLDSSHDSRHPSLVINKADFSDAGMYRLKFIGLLSKELQLRVTGSKPIVPVCKIKEDGENQIIVCEASVAPDSPEITSVQWTKNGDVIDTKLASDTYSGGTVGNPSLTIRVTDPSVIGEYQCCVGNDVGKTQSQIFYLDDILAIAKKYQSVLRYLIIQQGYKLNFKNRENDMNHEETNLKDIKKLCETAILNRYIIHTEEYCEFSSTSKRHDVFLSLSKKVGFIDYFLKHAAKENLKEYIRSSGYRVKVNESCYLLESREQTKVWIEKIGLDGILAHCTLEDESIHEEIASQFQVPIEILKMDKDDLENFKRHLRNGMQEVFHARGMIVGCAGAGKTTLMRKLQNWRVDDVESTRGLEVHKNVFIIEDDSLKVSKESVTSYLASSPDQFISRKWIEKQPDHKQSSRTVEHGLETNSSSDMGKKMTTERSSKAKNQNTDDSPKLIDENKDYNRIKADSEEPKQKRTQLAHNAFDGNLKRREEIQGTEIDNNKTIGKKADGGVKHNDPSPHSSEIAKQKINAKQSHSEYKKPEHNLSLPSIVPTMFKKNVRKTVTMLDFAGQIIYYACHQAYMSPRAFYILVLNSKKDLEAVVDDDECDDKDSIYRKMKHKDFFRYWVKSIHTYGTGSAKFPPLLVVFSNFEDKDQMEERKCKSIISKIISQEISNDKNIILDEISEDNIFFVEKYSSRDLKKLQDCIKNTVESLPHWGEKHPCAYVVVENIIETMKEREKIIDLHVLYEIVEQGEHNISKPDLKARLRFFHEIGIILYFDEEKLQDLIVLDVQWLVDAFKNIITTASHAKEDLNEKELYSKWEEFHDSAVLSNNLLDAIWKNQARDFVQHKKLILLYMERLGMLAKIKDEEWYVPCVNKKAFKRKDFETFNCSSILCFQFDFLPEVIFYRLVASCFGIQNWKIGESEQKQCLFQRVSLFQDDTKKTHLILVGRQNNAICIQVLTPRGIEIDKDFTVRVQKNISPVLNRLSKTFHTNLKEILIGSMCKKVLFGEDLNLHFVRHPSSDTLELCNKCPMSEWQEQRTNDFFSFWEKTESHDNLKAYCEYLNAGAQERIKDDILTKPKEVQLVLCFLLLQDNFQINIRKEDLSLPFEFLDCKIQSKEELKNILRMFKDALIPYIDELDGRYQINSDIRDDLVLSLMKTEEFVDIFVEKACIDNIKKYCRTTTYKAKDGEICFKLDGKQTESFIERLQYDILTHATMDDIKSHNLIASKLKIPIAILHRGKVGIQEYLQQLSKGKVCVYHAQGMIVGCAGAGKTTLLKKLKGCPLSDILDTVSTRGVDIQSDVFSVAEDELSENSEEKTLHLNIQQSEVAPERDAMISNEEKYNHQLREAEEVERNRTKEKQLKPRFPENTVDDTMPNRTQEKKDNVYITSEEDDIQPKPQKLEHIQALSFLSDTKEKTPKTITIFDFAGQLAYYVTHEIFMRPRAFYVFVIDMTKNLDDPVEESMTKQTYKEIIRHWMQMIDTFNRMAPVILVATHAEGKSRENIKKFFHQIRDLIPENIQKRHLHYQREFAVELKKTFGIVEIKRSILHIVSKADHWGEVRPTSWVMFESYLVKTKERIKVIKTEDLWTENKHLDTKFQLEKEEDMKKMLQFFHDTGAILFFDEDGLRNDIILDVPWFVDAFKHIITDPVHANEDFVRIRDTFVSTHCECKTALMDLEKSGILRVSLVHAIWKLDKDRYDTFFKHMRELMRYMERLGMLAKLTNSPEETWYVPCMNKRLFSKQEFENFNVSQTLCFQFKFLPPSIYHRLISSCLNQLGFTIPHWPKAKYFYKNAVLLHRQNFEQNFYVLIWNDEFQNRIDMQFLSSKDFKVDRKISTILKNEITDKLQGLKETFHTNLGSFTIGYLCTINIFSKKSAGHFIPESDFKGTTIICPDCHSVNRIVVQDVLYQWNQEGETVPRTDEDQTSIGSKHGESVSLHHPY